jgi:hypothetical protein
VFLLAPASCPASCIATLTVPLALYLILGGTAVGGFATVAYLSARGGLTPGFLKFVTVTYLVFALIALLVVFAAPPASYSRLLAVQTSASRLLPFLQALFVLVLGLHVVLVWRGSPRAGLTWSAGLLVCVVLLLAIAVALAPIASSPINAGLLGLSLFISSGVLGAATTGMLLGHWYLVTPALTNKPLLGAIAVLLAALILQAVVFPLTLSGVGHSESLVYSFSQSPLLAGLWLLGAVFLPLLAAGLALPACRIRSFMSTTGLLYMAMIAVLPGQLIGFTLLFITAAL